MEEEEVDGAASLRQLGRRRTWRSLPDEEEELVDSALLAVHLFLYHASNPSSLRLPLSLPGARSHAVGCPWPRLATALLPPSASAALLSMLRRLRLRGHSSFFVLADPAPSDPSSPTVLSRLSRGLLARAATASRMHDMLFACALLFTATPASPTPDALTLAEPLLADLDAFVTAMDEICGGAFLRSSAADTQVMAV
ncbi:hypothetical protein ZWY2020_057029 [Hordeum vulgare]|nr:hypothetical protein ZWY2020_057029 [Hordeum vulgare]